MKQFDKLVNTIKILRSPKGCPWDRAQRIDNMKGYLLEEVYELIDSIDKKNIADTKEELGDIFLILIVISQMFKEKGRFELTEVLDQINNKLISRHPHVFSSKKLDTKEEVLSHWIKSKAKKKKRKSIKDRLPSSGPSLLLANIFYKEQSHLSAGKFDERQVSKALAQINKRLKSIKKMKNKDKLLGLATFELAKIAFIFGIDLEGALRKTVLSQAQKTSYQHCKK